MQKHFITGGCGSATYPRNSKMRKSTERLWEQPVWKDGAAGTKQTRLYPGDSQQHYHYGDFV